MGDAHATSNGVKRDSKITMDIVIPIPEDKRRTLKWKTLNYHLPTSRTWMEVLTCSALPSGDKGRSILKDLSGEAKDGSFTAILGPSGSGKSTLLNCLFGHKKDGLTGEVMYHNYAAENPVCMIQQTDFLFDQLTVRETLTFAASIRVKQSASDLITERVDSILKKLWLVSCADLSVAYCSGGQQKRVSIGCELVSDPGMLFLDEPTSGLDAATSMQCVQLLKQIVSGKKDTRRSLAIIITIHQPSARVMELFDNLYILTRSGECLYFGPPKDLVTYLTSVGFTIPKFHNPCDFAIEVASGEYGEDKMRSALDTRRPSIVLKGLKVLYPIRNGPDSNSGMYTLRLLLNRHWKIITREPLLTYVRLISHIVVGIVASLLFGPYSGKANGCYVKVTTQRAMLLVDQARMANQNITLLFFILFLLTFTSLTPTILTFPSELKVFMKEHSNGWYKTGLYFLSVTLIDLPFQVILPTLFTGILYPATGQMPGADRFFYFTMVSCLACLCSQSVGILISTLFTNSMKVIVFLAPVALTPTFLFSGFFVRPSMTPRALIPFAWMSYVKHALNSMIAAVYGINRCRYDRSFDPRNNLPRYYTDQDRVQLFVGNDSLPLQSSVDGLDVTTEVITSLNDTSAMVDETSEFVVSKMAQYSPNVATITSYILEEFQLMDGNSWEIWKGTIILLFICFVLRIVAYYFLVRKTKMG